MGLSNSFIAELIEAGSGAYAAYAAQKLLETERSAARRFEPDPHGGWRDHLRGRLRELAAAIEVDQPDLFARRIAWTKAAFEARGLPTGELESALRELRRVLEEELPKSREIDFDRWFAPAMEALRGGSEEVPQSLDADSPTGRLAAQYLVAVLEGDRRRASSLILDKVPGELCVREVYLDVLVPAEVEIGRLWHLNEITIAEEAFATSIAGMVLSQLYPYLEREASNGLSVMTMPATGNTHVLATRMLGDFFEMAGWRVVPFTSPLPETEVANAVNAFRPDVLTISASMTSQLRSVRSMIQRARSAEAGRSLKVLVGGAAFEGDAGIAERLGADGFAQSVDEAVTTAGGLAGAAKQAV